MEGVEDGLKYRGLRRWVCVYIKEFQQDKTFRTSIQFVLETIILQITHGKRQIILTSYMPSRTEIVAHSGI